MGMYTRLRFKGIIKKECRPDIEKMLEIRNWSESITPVLFGFNTINRSFMIPFGVLACMYA